MPPSSGFSFSDRKSYLIYFLLLLFFVAAVALILWLGPEPQINTNGHGSSLTANWTANLWQNFRSPLSVLLVQIVVILAAAALVSKFFRHIGQPPVMGEMVAGIILGPSVLGFFFPGAMSFIFPSSSLETLRLLSQIS